MIDVKATIGKGPRLGLKSGWRAQIQGLWLSEIIIGNRDVPK